MRSPVQASSLFRQAVSSWTRNAVGVVSRPISISSPIYAHNYQDYQIAGHPPNSFHLRYTDPQPIQEHARDVRLNLSVEEAQVTGPQPDALYKTIELEMLAYETAVLDSYEWFVVAAATHLGIPIGQRWAPVKLNGKAVYEHRRFNLLRSVFVHKKHQVHYEVRTYHRILNLHKLTGSTADTFLEYIERNLPEGVGLKVTKFQVMKMPEYLNRDALSETTGEELAAEQAKASQRP